MNLGRRLHAVCLGAAVLYAGCASGGGDRVFTQIDGRTTRSAYDSILFAPTDGQVGYIIGYGDILDVIFMFNREYSREGIRVLPDGTIAYPHAGTIQAAGMTVSQLDSLLTHRFSDILLDPDLTVIIREFQSQNIYVLGELEAPGIYAWENGMTLIGALSAARGYSRDARRSNVVLIRRVAENHVVGVEVDVGKILDGKDFSIDIPVRPFDIVYVPRSRIATTEQFIGRMWTILGRPLDIYIKGWQAAHQKTYYDYYARFGQGEQ
ncbi:MAG: polysaccharide export protein [Candidatus Krumholzibacteria bacterium]|nr:polysaccharide export protein [Candidatus Krumholzibacteria bacterium]